MNKTKTKQEPLITRRKMRFDTYFTILNAIHDGISTKRAIREKTKISWASCSDIINDLSDLQIIIADDDPKHQLYRPGPKTTVYKFNDQKNLILGLEITPESINATVIDLGKNILFKKQYHLQTTLSDETINPVVQEIFYQILDDSQKSEDSIIGLVFALTGAIDMINLRWITTPKIYSINSIEFSTFKTLFPHVKHLAIEHDIIARANSIIENGGKYSLNFAFLHVSDGVGMTVMNNGSYIRGSRGFAGELGHIQLLHYDRIKGVPCFCGKTNCLESKLSSKALINHIKESFGITLNHIDELNQKCTQKEIDDFYQAFFEVLSNTLVTITNLFDPEIILIGGKVIEIWYDTLQETLLPHIKENSWQQGPKDIQFYFEEMSNPSYGAAISVIHKIMENLVLEALE
ncbi:MAG: ROK family protein [Sphaerochaetaceae bacterium]